MHLLELIIGVRDERIFYADGEVDSALVLILGLLGGRRDSFGSASFRVHLFDGNREIVYGWCEYLINGRVRPIRMKPSETGVRMRTWSMPCAAE